MSLEALYRKLNRQALEREQDHDSIHKIVSAGTENAEPVTKVMQKRTTSAKGGRRLKSTLGYKVKKYGG